MFNQGVKVHPYLNDVPYTKLADNQLPLTPVLSILRLSFYPDVNMTDQSQPISNLWHSSLEFVSTIPGFRKLHWAVEHQQPAENIILLIQWESGLSVPFRLQSSAGLSDKRIFQPHSPIGASNTNFRLELQA
ncbi:hypothetical protein BP5796_01193 [Coleophoma crateriformis]|uniref:ABM domain-containing protein n=1 Tax=Coleophoma crateriformis TaxID=565419 RepID=A0A3D8SZX8_9HELO|nr:hypothetical protein BP5796_01193 [Coleophoma crateriformis]